MDEVATVRCCTSRSTFSSLLLIIILKNYMESRSILVKLLPTFCNCNVTHTFQKCRAKSETGYFEEKYLCTPKNKLFKLNEKLGRTRVNVKSFFVIA